MKKILFYINIIIVGVVFISSCNMNKYPTFDDKNAFVAFDNTTISIDETVGFVEVPVTLASASGTSTFIMCELLDSTAESGVNYELVGDGKLTFTSEARTQMLKIKILNKPGTFTGDLRFKVAFASTGDVKQGAANSCLITISDKDHPLSSILGDYDVAAINFNGGSPVPTAFVMSILKDDTDVSKIWFKNIAGLNTGPGFYGIVNHELTEITIPIGQSSTTDDAGANGDGVMYLHGCDGNAYLTEGSMVASIGTEGGKLVIDLNISTPAVNAGGIGYYLTLIPPYKATKK